MSDSEVRMALCSEAGLLYKLYLSSETLPLTAQWVEVCDLCRWKE